MHNESLMADEKDAYNAYGVVTRVLDDGTCICGHCRPCRLEMKEMGAFDEWVMGGEVIANPEEAEADKKLKTPERNKVAKERATRRVVGRALPSGMGSRGGAVGERLQERKNREARERRERRKAERVVDEDGRLKHPGANVKHGTRTAYQEYFCRCLTCATARGRNFKAATGAEVGHGTSDA